MNYDIYQSPLVQRNAGPEMLRLFSPAYKFGLWRKLWFQLAACQRELGLTRISAEALQQMEKAANEPIDFAKAEDWEKRLRHDLMAHLRTFEEAAPAAKGINHIGATSMDIVDNADLIIMRDALQLIAKEVAAVIQKLSDFAQKWKDLPTLSYTHYQPAQLTTVGKRATLWAYDFVLDLQAIEHLLATLKFRGIKGTTGTQASFLAIFNGDHAKVEALDRMMAQKFAFADTYPVTGQTYSRKVDAQAISLLANIAAGVHKFANDIRLLAGMKQIEEPFEEEQVGSSAMAYKRNPMLSERATGLARFVISLSNSMLQTAAEQWLERSLDDSSNKRLVIPEPFLAIDGCLRIVLHAAGGLVVYPRTIEAAVNAELPFMATEEILMAAVAAGGDRQELHEIIRRNSLAAAEQVKLHGRPNDLLERLKKEPAFRTLNLDKLLAPSAYIGRAPQQVENFVNQIAAPAVVRYGGSAESIASLSV